MEFIEEEARPRFLFQSRASSSSTSKPEIHRINKLQAAICALISSILSISAIVYFESQTLQFVLFWVAFSLLVGPFAPISVTGGDIRVGTGETLEFPDLDDEISEPEESKKRNPSRRSKTRKFEDPRANSQSLVPESVKVVKTEKKIENSVPNGISSKIQEEKEWNEEDFEILKKQISKHPVGKPRRWELIAEAFQGRHGVDSVITMAKSMVEKRSGANDPFSQFLKQRKPLSKKLEGVDADQVVPIVNGEDKKEIESVNWTSGEDIALLNALKAFPKDVNMRWEKIAAAVPGKTKASCMKRVAELKRDFRGSKASET